MTMGSTIELRANLKDLKLSTMARNLEASFRQARESGIDYEDFLIELTTSELQARAENRLARRTREAKFPLLKPMETFDLGAVPELDIRLFRDLATAAIFMKGGTSYSLGEAAQAKPIW